MLLSAPFVRWNAQSLWCRKRFSPISLASNIFSWRRRFTSSLVIYFNGSYSSRRTSWMFFSSRRKKSTRVCEKLQFQRKEIPKSWLIKANALARSEHKSPIHTHDNDFYNFLLSAFKFSSPPLSPLLVRLKPFRCNLHAIQMEPRGFDVLSAVSEFLKIL